MEDFTIADCESYINRYPYGEHILEVKAHHRKLNSAPPKKVDNKKKEKKSEPVQVVQKKPQEKKHVNKRNTYKKQKTEPIVSYDKQTIQYKAERNETITRNNDDKENVLMILSVILGGIVVVVVIVLFISFPTIMFPISVICGFIGSLFKKRYNN